MVTFLTQTSCLCHGFQDIGLPGDLPATATDAPEWNSDFSSWLPRYHKPAHACDYCRSRSLECFIYNTGGNNSSGCSPCNALFRPCSFSDPEKMAMQKSRTALDTLDVVTEDAERHFGGFTGKKPMRSLGHVGPIEDDLDSEKPKKGASAARFPRAAVKVLKDWMIAHIDHPYPTEADKEALGTQTGLTISQISNWMANTRRRQKNRPKRSASPSIRPSTKPMNIPAGRTWDEMNPFERWKHSPPENEPAPLTAIAKAVETFDLPEPDSLSSSYNGRSRKGNSNDSTGSFSVFRAPSTTSLETGFTNMSSGSVQSHGTAWSHGSRNSFTSLNSLNSKKERRRRRRIPARAPKIDLDSAPRLYQCTFCTDRFKSKYDWARHEKSLHLSLEKWICAPIGEVIISASGQRKCVFCDTLDPTKEHLETHNYRGCEEKGLDARTFYRKDHLRQHLRLMHRCKMTASMESWKSEAQFIRSRCGFCAMDFDKWQDRVDHLAKEFRNGAVMQDWKGCRGLDPHVALHVTNAMPPYLIATESKSPFPFSATNSASMKRLNLSMEQDDIDYLLGTDTSGSTGMFIADQLGNMNMQGSSSVSPTAAPTQSSSGFSTASISPKPNPNATCWEVLTLRLGRFARQHIESHGTASLTDDLLQRHAREILYGSDDPWNQTAADNPEWLGLFKQSHGIPTQAPWSKGMSHHEVLEDLGIGAGAKVDSSFNLEHFTDFRHGDWDSNSVAYQCLLSGTLNNAKNAYRQFGSNTPQTLPELGSSTTSGVSNLPTTTSFDLPGLDAPISELACTTPGGICIGEDGELGFAVRSYNQKQNYFLSKEGQCSLMKDKNVSGECSLLNNDSMAPIVERECTKAGEPVLPLIQERACTKSGDPIFPSIQETPCTAAGEPMQSQFGSSTWDNALVDFDLPSTSAGFVASLPVSTGPGAQPQVMHWDDSELELGFNIDMDLDLDVDLATASSGMNQRY